MIGKQLAISVAVTLTAACAPLEQAPLVYSSSHQIGVGVSSGTPNAPGLDVTLGYKGIDAAYVPVAVAKPCAPSTTCTSPREIVKIEGRSNIADDQSIDAASLARLDRDIETLRKATVVRAEQLVKPKLVLEKFGAQTNLESTPVPTDPLQAAERLQRISAMQGEIAALTTDNRATVEKAVERLNADQLADSSALGAREQERANLLNARRTRSADSKYDAYSVYGTFEGNATGTKDGAGLALGKVFSTGIAAQFLTQGIRVGSEIAQTTLCLNALQAAAEKLDSTPKKSLLEQANKICGPRVSAN